MALASKKVVIACPDFHNANARWIRHIYNQLDQGNLPVLAPEEDDLDWSDAAVVNEYLQLHKPHLLLSAMPQGATLPRLLKDPVSRDYVFAMVSSLADYAASADVPLLHVSNYRVFGEEAKNIYYESDEPAPISALGETILEIEKLIAARLPKHLILRTSWVIDTVGDNLLTAILNQLMKPGELSLSRRSRGCPTWGDDLVRVICGVIRQIMAGADNWGAFHYCSSDATTQWEFGQDVEATLKQQLPADFELPGLLVKEEKQTDIDVTDKQQVVASASLSCRQIRNNFGVHGRTWRQGLSGKISEWLKENYPELALGDGSTPSTP